MTMLKQRRTSTQLKVLIIKMVVCERVQADSIKIFCCVFQYDFLERQLTDKAADKSRIPNLFSKASKERTTPSTEVSEASDHIRKEMGELKKRLDCLDKRSEEHTSELQSRPHISYAVFCLKKKTQNTN